MTDTDTFRVERTAVIAAPAETVFPFIDDFHQWALWSPWENIDAELAKTYSGADLGVGAIYEWSGKKTGVGRMEITTSTPSSQVDIDLQFLKPMKTHNQASFTLTPALDGTTVVWSMTGRKNPMMKLMGLFFNMDKMIGKDFEKGLASLKALSEAKAPA